MRIRTKILSLSAAFVLGIGVVAGVGLQTIKGFGDLSIQLDRTHTHAFQGEHLDKLVTNVVMESRGIYVAKDVAGATKFADGLKATLGKIETLIADWQPNADPVDEKAQLELVAEKAKEFATFRRETARLGIEESPLAANVFGNNEENRANRKAFQTEIEKLVAINKGKLEDVQAQSASFEQAQAWQFFGYAALGSLVLLTFSLWLSVFGISRPLQRVTDAVSKIADGAYDTAIPDNAGKDEIGDLWRAIRVLRDKAREADALKAEQVNREAAAAAVLIAERNAIADRFQAAMGQLATDFAASSKEVADAAEGLSATAEETSRQAQAAAGAAEEAAMNVQTVASSTEELSASVQEINSQVVRSSTVASSAAEEAARTAVQIQTLSDAAMQIGDVVSLISAIAAQTNLLALNATIEAARAGEAGRGFAVVASEVKNLAGQTAKATEEIGRKVSEIQGATTATVQSIGAIVGTIETIRKVTSSIAEAVEQQGAATSEIAANTQRASAGTQEVNGNIAGVGQAAEMTGTAATQLMTLSSKLETRAVDLQDQVTSFVRTLRSA